MTRRMLRIALLVVAILGSWGSLGQAQVKNVILMVSDGAGFNSWTATSMYQGRWDATAGRSTQVYDAPGWIHLACSTHALNTSSAPTGNDTQDAALVYDPLKAWDPEKGYEWLNTGPTDSAAAGTALSTGTKSFLHAINWSSSDAPLKPTAVEVAKAAHKSVGIVTTVHWSDATPATLGGAHASQRKDIDEIAREMLEAGQLDVIMGGGNPDFDGDGRPREEKKVHKYVGGEEVWRAIEEARATPEGTYQGFRPVSTRAEFESLLSGPVPSKVLGTAQVAKTLQESRNRPTPNVPPYTDPSNPGVPSLTDMTRGALRVLGQNPSGMFLMVEGGAIDWANHKHDAGRMIEEHSEFLRAVQAVVEWVETHSNWQETVLILTADHDTGLLWGPESEATPFQPLVDHGIGKLPGFHYNSRQHTNALVPVYARGEGAELLAKHVRGSDPVRGPYLDNTDIALSIQTLLGAACDRPEPVAKTAAPTPVKP